MEQEIGGEIRGVAKSRVYPCSALVDNRLAGQLKYGVKRNYDACGQRSVKKILQSR